MFGGSGGSGPPVLMSLRHQPISSSTSTGTSLRNYSERVLCQASPPSSHGGSNDFSLPTPVSFSPEADGSPVSKALLGLLIPG